MNKLNLKKILVADFRNYLREHNQPFTEQRQQVAEVIASSNMHLGAEEILDEMKKRRTGVGKATVYRTLELLTQSGLVLAHDFGDGYKRYEHTINQPHHDHLICQGCKKVIEFENHHIEELQEKIVKKFEFTPTWHRLELYGLCKDCTKKKKK